MNEFQSSGLPTQVGGSGEMALSPSPRGRGDRVRFGWCRSERGATAVEYAIMVSLIALVIVGAVTVFGQNVIQLFQVPASAL